VIEKAKHACVNSDHNVKDHFEDVLGMFNIGPGAQRGLKDVILSRYACCLVVQNGDPSKLFIAASQIYFSLQTKRQELTDSERFKQK